MQWQEDTPGLEALLAQAQEQAAQRAADQAASTISLLDPTATTGRTGDQGEAGPRQGRGKRSLLLEVQLDAGVAPPNGGKGGIPGPLFRSTTKSGAVRLALPTTGGSSSSSILAAEGPGPVTSLDTFTPALPPALQEDPKKSKGSKGKATETAGSKWFDMPATDITPEIRKDLLLLKARAALDPKRHYKKEDKGKGLPKFFQVGTIVTEAADYYQGRLTHKERQASIVEELLVDQERKRYFKKKYLELQAKKSRFTKLKGKGLLRKRGRKEH